MPKDILRSEEPNAVFSRCGRYRYVLTRQLGSGTKTATFIMLNPSTADATHDDPTIRRCMGFARHWWCGRLIVLNLFAFRATFPQDLKHAPDPVGPRNKVWVKRTLSAIPVEDREAVVCGWGVHGSHRQQDAVMREWLKTSGIESVALGMTRDGHPRHPLYAPYASDLNTFTNG
jgi:hypothetical protein